MVKIKLNLVPRIVGLISLGVVVTSMLAPSVAAPSCQLPVDTGAMQTSLPVGSLDQMLFGTAVLEQVNYQRCRQGLFAISIHTGLSDVAGLHAEWMASRSTLSHHSTTQGQENVEARIIHAISKASTGSENIGFVHRFRVDEADVFYATQNACSFRTRGGQPIGTHSYSSLAKRIVDLWMNSPGHRENVLGTNISWVGNAVAFDSAGPYCGVYYMSQNFAG